MANNYLEYSESIENLTEKEIEWWKSAVDDQVEGEDCDYPGKIYVNAEARRILFYTEEYGDPEAVAELVQPFLKQFRPGEAFHLSWAETCSKPRVGEFGGGAVYVTADRIEWCSTGQFIEDCHKNFPPRV